MPLNAFQQGQKAYHDEQASIAATERQNLLNEREVARQRGVNALAQEFGDKAYAPTVNTQLRSTERADKQFIAKEEQRGLDNERTIAQDLIEKNKQEQELLVNNGGRLVDAMLKAQEGGVPIEKIVNDLAPVIQGVFKMGDEELSALPATIAQNPEYLPGIAAAFKQQKEKRAIGKPETMVMPDGSVKTRQFFSDGTSQDVGGRLLSSIGDEVTLDRKNNRLGLRETELKRKLLNGTLKEVKGIVTERSFSEAVTEAAKTVVRDVNNFQKLAKTAAGFKGNSFAEAAARAIGAGVISTQPADMQKLIDSIKSNIGIDSLLRIKRAGTGLGQVPQSQLETLQSLLGNLSMTRNPKLLLKDLADIKERYNDVIAGSNASIAKLDKRELHLLRRRSSLEKDIFGEEPNAQSTSIDALLEKYK